MSYYEGGCIIVKRVASIKIELDSKRKLYEKREQGAGTQENLQIEPQVFENVWKIKNYFFWNFVFLKEI